MRTKLTTNRIAVIFSDDAVAWIEEEAARRAVSLADLLRRIVDETRGAYIVPPRRHGQSNS
jgi:hypothetical protein